MGKKIPSLLYVCVCVVGGGGGNQFISHRPQYKHFGKCNTLPAHCGYFSSWSTRNLNEQRKQYAMLHFRQPRKLISNNRMRNCFFLLKNGQNFKDFNIAKEKYWWTLNILSLRSYMFKHQIKKKK